MALLMQQGPQRLAGRLLLLVALAVGMATPCALAAQARGEYEVKAAFLLNFARLIDWPEEAAPGAAAPFVICVAGSGPAYEAIAASAREATVDDLPVRVRRSQGAADTEGCRIQFVGAEIGVPDRSELRAMSRSGAVSVGESAGFAARGGVINFFSKQKKIRFEINREAAREAGIRISSRLLSLARIVSSED